MADIGKVPKFTKGEPGFADKLNELGGLLQEVIDHLNTKCPARAEDAPVAPRPVRAKATPTK